MRSLGVDRPVTRIFYPKWSLKIVLNYLLKELFEHISKCSLENLTLKTVFLVMLASGRRRSEIHALSVDPECFRFSPNLSRVSLLTKPGFLSKTQKSSKMPAKIVIQSLAKHVGHDLPDYVLCPVRALKAYKDKTKSEAVRKNRKRLFIPYRDSQDDIRPYHISKWIVELVKRSHRDANDDAYQLAITRSEPLPLPGPRTTMLPLRRSCRRLATLRSPPFKAGRWPHTLRAYTTWGQSCRRRKWSTFHHLCPGHSPGFCINCTVNQDLSYSSGITIV